MAKAKKIEEWDINSAVDTLIRAEEIKNDKNLFPKVKKAFVEKQAALQKAALAIKITRRLDEMHKEK